jgi:DNA-binding transcriptional MerR regulator
MQKLGDYLTVGQAAEFLGVSAWTLRYWDRTGKLEPSRHPLSRYRLYRRDHLEALLQATANSGRGRLNRAEAVNEER